MQITYRFQVNKSNNKEEKFNLKLIIFYFSWKNLLKICKNEQEKTKLVSSFNMLMDPKKMGQRFKLLAFRKFNFKQNPPGFDLLAN